MYPIKLRIDHTGLLSPSELIFALKFFASPLFRKLQRKFNLAANNNLTCKNYRNARYSKWKIYRYYNIIKTIFLNY